MWPIVFEISFKSTSRLEFGKRGDYAQIFAESVNYGSGAPAPIVQGQYDQLIDYLRKISN